MKSRLSVALAALTMTVALAGCGGGDDGTASPTSPTGTTTPTTPAKEPPPPAGNALRSNYTFQPNSNIAEVTFTISTNWSQLTVTPTLFKNAACGALYSERNPPATTEVAPQITLTSPTSKKIGPIALGSYNSCDSNTGTTRIASPTPATGASEMGTWKLLINGRGVNVLVEAWVAGK